MRISEYKVLHLVHWRAWIYFSGRGHWGDKVLNCWQGN